MQITDTSLTLPIIGPDPTYEDRHIWLPQLTIEAAQAGSAMIEGKTFINCRFEGPAVLLPLGRTSFSNCNLGDSMGDARNLLLKPMGAAKVTGIIPVRDCTFEGCAFFLVGFTGPDAFLEQFQASLEGTPA